MDSFGNNSPYGSTGQGQQQREHHSTSELFSDAKVMADAARGGKVDRAKFADAAGDLLDVAGDCGRLDGKAGVGKYVDKAADYLHSYSNTGSQNTTKSDSSYGADSDRNRSGGTNFGDSLSGGGGYGDSNRSGGGYGDNNRSGGGYGDNNRSGGGYGDNNRSGGGFGDNLSGGGYGGDGRSGGGYGNNDRERDGRSGGGYGGDGRDGRSGGGYGNYGN